jgi:hypothetical protein
VPGKRANVKDEKQYEALKDKGMSKERAAKIAWNDSPEGVNTESRAATYRFQVHARGLRPVGPPVPAGRSSRPRI